MANIDTSMIEGFDGMTADEKVTALLGLQIPDPVDLSGYVKKDVFDAKATEAASLAKQLKTKTVEAETATGTLSTTQAELEAIKRSYYVASKGLTGDDAEFIAFKAGKMVDDTLPTPSWQTSTPFVSRWIEKRNKQRHQYPIKALIYMLKTAALSIFTAIQTF